MADTKYAVGLIANVDGYSTFLWQSNNLTVECDEYEAKDEKGNTKVVQHINHRVKGSVEAIVPLDTSLPVPGQTVTLKGITLPTVDADGKVSGSLTLNSADSGAGRPSSSPAPPPSTRATPISSSARSRSPATWSTASPPRADQKKP